MTLTTPAPKREEMDILDPITSTRIGSTPEPIDRWIHRGWAAARKVEPKPLEEVIALDPVARHELLMEVDYRHVAGLLGPRPKIFGMDIVTDPDVDGYEIRTNTLADWVEHRAQRGY